MCQREEEKLGKAMPQPGAGQIILEACKQHFSLRMLPSHLVEVNISGANLYYLYYLQINYFNPLYINSLLSRKVYHPHFWFTFY